MYQTELEKRAPAWQAPAEVTTLAGAPVPPEMDFFVPPPPEIGEVVAVYSTLSQNKEPVSPMTRLIICLMNGFVFWLLPSLVVAWLAPRETVAAIIIGAIIGMIALTIAVYYTRFKHSCSYVGKQGMARYTVSGSRDAMPKQLLLEFRYASDLYTGQTRNYYNGVYTGTNYFFKWTDNQGRVLLNLAGRYSSQQGTPKATDPYYFASVGEIAWSEYLLDALQAELEKNGSVEFKVNKHDAVRVGPGFMEFLFGGKQQRVDGEALKHISINGGQFSFKTSEAKWYSGKGKFNFSYQSMANARLFLLVIHSLLGVRFD